MYRQKGVLVLDDYANAEEIEEIIHNDVVHGSEHDKEYEYLRHLYNILGTPDYSSEELTSGKVGWDCYLFDKNLEILEEKDNFLTKPIEVEEGIFTCKKCGSNKTYSFTKQVRSGDEGTSVFVRCLNGHVWRES